MTTPPCAGAGVPAQSPTVRRRVAQSAMNLTATTGRCGRTGTAMVLTETYPAGGGQTVYETDTIAGTTHLPISSFANVPAASGHPGYTEHFGYSWLTTAPRSHRSGRSASEPPPAAPGHLQRAPSFLATWSCAESKNSLHVNTGVPLLPKPVMVPAYPVACAAEMTPTM